MGDQVFLKMVTSATTKPPMRPPIIQGMAASGVGDLESPQVQAAVATTQRRSTPVLLTVPCNVMASPKATCPLNAFSFNAGFDVRIRLATAGLPEITSYSLHSPKQQFQTDPQCTRPRKTPAKAAFGRWRSGSEPVPEIPADERFSRKAREFRRYPG